MFQPPEITLSVEELIEEMNHDTITSLRTFVDSAHLVSRRASNISTRRHSHFMPGSRKTSTVSARSHDHLELPRVNHNPDSSDNEDDPVPWVPSSAANSRSASIHSMSSMTSEIRDWMRSIPRKLSFKSKCLSLPKD